MDGVVPINLAIEFHDSEVSSVALGASELRVAFSAAIVHASDGAPGSEDGIVVLQAVEMVLHGINGSVETEGCVGKLSDGYVEFEGSRQSMLPVPSSRTGSVRIDLSFANGSSLVASGGTLEVSRHGEPQFLEVFRC